MRRRLAVCLLLFSAARVQALPASVPLQPMQLGIDADNWSGQTQNPQFEKSLKQMGIDFISWHIQPEEEASQEHLDAIVQFCRRNHWKYLFNNEVGNYRRDDSRFQHPDGTYRYDLAEHTLRVLKDDPLFLGVVYDETDLMQSMLGISDEKGKPIPPYLANTRNLPPAQAFQAVAAKVAELNHHYESYGKRLIFEMTFPDYPFAYASGGALLAPKLMKENFNDLMYSVYRGAALEYQSKELWACVDLWFLGKFPYAGKYDRGFHTPAQLLETLEFAYADGFDYAYIEQVKGLLDANYDLSEYGKAVVEFQSWRRTHKPGNWRTAPIDLYVKRFPDGYWGQDYHPFIPDHPYGSWTGNPYRKDDEAWFKTLQALSHDAIPADADTWNASRSPQFAERPYQTMAGLPAMVVFDQFGEPPLAGKAKVIDLSPNAGREALPRAANLKPK